MRVKKLQLKDFKRFSDLTIDLGNDPKKIVALVGPNGCGKSSVFDAFEEKAKDYKGGGGEIEFFLKSAFITGLLGYHKNEQILLEYDVTPDLKKTSFYLRSSYRFTAKINTNNIRKLPNMEEDSNRPQTSIELDSRMQENYERLIGGFYEEVYDKEKTGKQWAEENIKKLNEILSRILDIKVSSLGNPVEGKGKLYFEKGLSKNFPYELLSSGEKEVIDLIVDLILKTKSYNETIICIDEPELHINTAIQRNLIVELEKLVPESCQLWVATHSVGFIRALTKDLNDKCQIIDMGNSDFDTTVTLNPIKIDRVSMKVLFDTALDDLAGLIAPQKIIYCEGKNVPDENGKEQGIDSKIYNKIFNHSFPEVLFVSSGGGSEPRLYSEIALLVLQKAFLETEIIYLKDRGGKDGMMTDDERAKELQQTNKKVLARRELENYIFDPEILKKHKQDTDITSIGVSDWKKDYLKPYYQKIKQAVGWNDTPYRLMEELATLITEDTTVFNELRSDTMG